VDLFDERKAVPIQFRPKAVWATAAGYSDRLAFAVETLEEELLRWRLFGAVTDIPYIAIHLVTFSSWRGEAARVAWVSREEMRAGWDEFVAARNWAFESLREASEIYRLEKASALSTAGSDLGSDPG